MAGLFATLTALAGNNFPNRIKLGPEPTFSTTSTTSATDFGSAPKRFTKAAYNDGEPNMVVKWNVTQLAFRNLSFQFEYGFHKNFSGALGFNFLLKRSFPELFVEQDPTGEGLHDPELKGWAITPEFRFYPGRKEEKKAPRGFYLAPYFRYAKYTIDSQYSIAFSDGKNYSYDFQLTYSGYSAGLMIGQQWLIGKHFSIDWWIIGAGAGKAKIKMDAVGSGIVMNAQDQAEAKQQVEGEFSDSIWGYDADVSTTSNSIKAEVKGLSMISLRSLVIFGLNLGIAF